ncbi:histidine phosphatase family protein [Trichococcus shcherbakoviae]|uniref:histidine phosphatase family protein n=1 Tax=Trichococcus shcherbakoviae TaxID=2094020 RepID=UPI002AA7A9A1|nr:histidine phosphatase family protein [Trichococcus shcherbakoviae]
MLLYLVRHGETYLNKYGRMQGWSDAPLTVNGEKSAQLCGQRLKNIHFSGLYSSDFGRTIATAKLINAEIQQGLEIVPKAEFRETFFGIYEGEHGKLAWATVAQKNGFETVEQMYQTFSIEEMMDAFHFADEYHDADDYATFWARISRGLGELSNTYAEDEPVLLVTHGNVIRNIAYQVDSGINGAEELKNAAVTLIEYSEARKIIRFYNQTDLPEEEMIYEV